MNKKLISEIKYEDGSLRKTYSEEFNPQDVKIKYFDLYGNDVEYDDGKEIAIYNFEVSAPGINTLDVRNIKFPEFDYANVGLAKVIIEHVQEFDQDGVYQDPSKWIQMIKSKSSEF